MPLLPLDYLHHILDEAEFVSSHMQGLTLEEFMRAPTLQRAFVRSIEIIGEATKKAPSELRLKYPQIDWKSMAGMRDRSSSRLFWN